VFKVISIGVARVYEGKEKNGVFSQHITSNGDVRTRGDIKILVLEA
jgi:hypothetical protein